MVATRLIVDDARPGALNMALDEALLRAAAERETATLRFYWWSEPTVSLGYFQALAERDAHEESRALAIVRRATGGGAIVHHHELTYSFAAPTVANVTADDSHELYAAFHDSLVLALGTFGIAAEIFYGGSVAEPKPFLCFQRHTPGDVLCDGQKVAGSAQRKLRGAILQHGSVLLVQSPHAPQLPGVAELAGRTLTRRELIEAWSPLVAQRLGLQLFGDDVAEAELDVARKVGREKFAAPHWTGKR